MTPEAALPLHSRRVQAWVYTVINPVIEGLRRELELLEKGNLSWRFYSRKCEYIRSIRDYVDTSQWPNYEDFLADPTNEGFRDNFHSHDQALGKVESAAAGFFDGLMHSDLFQRQVQEFLTEYQANGIGNPKYPGLDPVDRDLPKYVAEYLINRVELLPDHYMTHAFWAGYRDRFDLSAKEFELYQQRESYQLLTKARASMGDVSRQVLSSLEHHRNSLCREFDIPFAPVVVDSSHGVDAFIVRKQ
jgi:hypothetical protein